jgi:hypothetical protein
VATIPLPTEERVGEHVVGILDGQEALPVAGRRIGMETFGEATVGGLHLLVRGAA